MTRIVPGHTMGILGSGQLGRMLAQSARQHGYRVTVFSPDGDSPTGQLADEAFVAPYDDLDAVRGFAAGADVVTFEFENVPEATARAAAEMAIVRPDPTLLYVAQNRIREKTAVEKAGYPVTPFRAVRTAEELEAAVVALGTPAVLKTASSGYDGKGQRRVDAAATAGAAWVSLGGGECVLEAFMRFERELSVVVARGTDGKVADFGVFENHHEEHILDATVSPARVPPEVAEAARDLAHGIARHLDLVGVLCVELFDLGGGNLAFNEIAPRPHNSGHLTIEAFSVSQFEQQLRAVCGLPLGEPIRRAPAAAMVNLLGDLWTYDVDGTVVAEPQWATLLRRPQTHLHLYGKKRPRSGRKMGHVTVLGDTPDVALAQARSARSALLASA